MDAGMPINDLQTLLDRERIRDLVHRYALAIDSRDWQAYRACFTDEVALDFAAASGAPPTWRTRSADDWVAECQAFFSRLTATQHIPALLAVDIAGDRATGFKQLHAQHYCNRFPAPVQTMTGRYAFEAVRDGDRWRFARLRLHVGWMEGDPAIIAYAYGNDGVLPASTAAR
ncbi:nuclear transport factor 2 family protein [Parapedomonas caeni]